MSKCPLILQIRKYPGNKILPEKRNNLEQKKAVIKYYKYLHLNSLALNNKNNIHCIYIPFLYNPQYIQSFEKGPTKSGGLL